MGMDKYVLYHNIKSVQNIVAQYPAAEDIFQELTKLAEQLSSRTYRVAVIGEFKRGKSSLVNCILGTEILPTDILPTTAVVNRIVYGTEQKIEICYKDGTVKNTSVEELAEYATKKNEMNAAQIREIIVHYPAVFGQNSIELLDTPGLNDDEFMDKTTLDVLDKIDTAIVTTHASYPVSETEKKLICRLIEQDDIYHLTFVATFIDRVSDEPDEQDEIIKLIRNRLSKETYQMFCQRHPNEPKLLEKAERILCKPVVFAVSSRLAMRGFVNGNQRMLDESRFPHFKYELSALLTANQELDLQMKAVRLIRAANENFAAWHEQLLDKLEADLAQAKRQLRSAQDYQKSGCPGLMEQLQQVDQELENIGIFDWDTAEQKSDYARRASWCVMRELLQIDPEKVEAEFVETALEDASNKLVCSTDADTEPLVHARMQKVNEYLIAAEKECGLTESGLLRRLEDWKASTPFPQMNGDVYNMRMMIDPCEAEERVRQGDAAGLAKWVDDTIYSNIGAFYTVLQEQIRSYIASWRSQILKQNIADKNEMGMIAEQAARQIRDIRQRKEVAEVNRNSYLNALEQAEEEVNTA